jgi:hypothetical protein
MLVMPFGGGKAINFLFLLGITIYQVCSQGRFFICEGKHMVENIFLLSRVKPMT